MEDNNNPGKSQDRATERIHLHSSKKKRIEEFITTTLYSYTIQLAEYSLDASCQQALI